MAAKAYPSAVFPKALRLTRKRYIMALKINNRAGIRETFAARPDLTEVQVLASGEHYFTVPPVDATAGQEVTVLQPGASELEDEVAPAKPAKA